MQIKTEPYWSEKRSISGKKWHPDMFAIRKRDAENYHHEIDPYDEESIAHAIDDLILCMKANGLHQAKIEKLRDLGLEDHGYLDEKHLATKSLLNFLFERAGNAE